MILNRDAICALIPHGGTMCLLDAVEHWDRNVIVCASWQHRLESNPLRVDGRLSSIHGIEFAAQSMAVHGGLLASRSEKPRSGLLMSVRQCVFHCERLDQVDAPMLIEAHRVAGSEDALSYRFAVRADGAVLIDGRANVMLRSPGAAATAGHSRR